MADTVPGTINHSSQTAKTLTLALQALSKAGATPEETREKLPAGVQSVQELSEAQAKQYLLDLRSLYIEIIQAKQATAKRA